MTYRIIIEPTAEREIRSAVRWKTENASPAVAARWYNGVIQKIETLRRHPTRCPLAEENDKFDEEIPTARHPPFGLDQRPGDPQALSGAHHSGSTGTAEEKDTHFDEHGKPGADPLPRLHDDLAQNCVSVVSAQREEPASTRKLRQIRRNRSQKCVSSGLVH